MTARKMNDYTNLIQTFLDAGYESIPFLEEPPDKQALMLRHDVDFDVLLAEEMAHQEHEMGIRSTYFFLLRSASYNLLEMKTTKVVIRIGALDHHLSLHFDPAIYEDFRAGLKFELDIFQSVFGIRPDCISIHRPNDFFLNFNSTIEGTRHTYQSLYFSGGKYFSDSQGEFKYGSPIASQTFHQRKSIHLLIHPLWWVIDETSPIKILNKFLDLRIHRFQKHIAANCKPYRTVIGGQNE